ncbi:phage tail protein [Janthinobacterium sp. UMAB-56]|uniref:phage tail protein n=1 Tax=Janthinobacterium sp. UMAB-56 TaxID=1365361 RepID=UPI001C573BED|nr:phage tail protein [Janthinobacterium sp. UMAB-56]
MMMILGMFVFSLPTLAYQELQRQTEWKHASTARVGLRDAHQYVGPGDDTITLSGWVAPELTGSLYSLDALRMMADTGKSWILIQGTGRILGSYRITSMTEGRTILDGSGGARRVEFSISLKRDDDGVLAMLGLGDIGDLKNMLSIDGITSSIAGAAKNAVSGVVGNVVGGITSKYGGAVSEMKDKIGGGISGAIGSTADKFK